MRLHAEPLALGGPEFDTEPKAASNFAVRCIYMSICCYEPSCDLSMLPSVKLVALA